MVHCGTRDIRRADAVGADRSADCRLDEKSGYCPCGADPRHGRQDGWRYDFRDPLVLQR